MDKIYEMCPHCENEVLLDFIFDVQICPSCGRPILPCSLCETCLGWNDKCPLKEKQAEMELDLNNKGSI
jgi:hypothetical protein